MAQSPLESYVQHLLNDPPNWLFRLLQSLLAFVLSPAPPTPSTQLSRPRIAVIGAGLTGVSSASHCVGHGFDVTIFEAGDEDSLGGIWAKVNNTSGLQIHSVMYRFHPSVKWSEGYPSRGEIVKAVKDVWQKYGLQKKTKFNTRVEKPEMSGQEKFKGKIFHSSQLDGKENDAKGRKVLVIGGGASAIEAMEFTTAAGAEKTYILSRSEKWIIPRNPIIDILLALNIFCQETVFSWIPENLLRLFFYRDLSDIAPAKNSGKCIFMETPMVNNDVLEQIRSGKASWLRGDIKNFEEDGIKFNHRSQGVPKNGPGWEELIEGDICILATGYERPSLAFLPDECFEDNYEPPNWYLQVFPPKHVSICANNCTYVNAIGAVGNWHIGIYTRFLLMFLVDPLARPTEGLMKLWIDFTRWVKRFAPTGAFDFFTYSELVYWFVFVILINPFRWKWALFVLTGRGAALPKAVVEQEDRFREKTRKKVE
ncbi:hypothetical protein CBER1_06402 [Cercospora berteroae]|uniref:FAD/NAD(P)-binding domain-containing protein n=1 Tax=Cercospora berteroae TaxID=357750 RepID=A0A2S6C6F4_9PEZI|nr:hypothetical protein CBER1_06402 [Cercospora berteroae]